MPGIAMFEPTYPPIRTPSLAHQKIVLWLAFLIILAVSTLAFLATQRLIALSASVEQSQNFILETSRFLSQLKDVESGGRGYFVTGDERYLQTQRSGIANIGVTAKRLRQLRENPEVERRLDRLFDLAAKRIELSRQLVVDQRPIATGAPQNVFRGTDVMDQARREAETIIRSQTQAYRLESARLERQAWMTSIAFAVGVVACLGMIAWLFAIRGREVERRRQLEEQLRALNLDLEDRVQERTAEVKRARDLLDNVVENLPDMVVLKEPDGDGFRYILINAAGEQLLGRERGDILGKTERDLFPPEEAALIVEANQAVIASGRARTFTERRLTAAAGGRTVETRMVPIGAGNGGSAMILAIIRDVSDAKAREEQLRQLQRMDAIGRLTGGVAHDFNNLLAIILGNSELLRGHLAEGGEDADMIDDVIGAAGRGAELVKRLLAFARMQHLEPESVDLNARLASITGLLQRSLGENVQVRIKPARKLWPAVVDATQVDDALVNLAINARDAMPTGGTLAIETENVALDEDYAAQHVEVTPGDYVMLAVSDTGTGMPPDVIARVFEPFFTTKQEGHGTGLGLSQVFGWVKQSGGHIKVYSEVGHGTTIKLYLPRADAASVEKEAPAEAAPPSGDETILVVEDNPNVRKTVLRQLGDLGYGTIEAEDGAAALRLAREGASFDLLLTDVIMPGGITGYELAHRLRAERPDLKVLFTSGYTELAAPVDEAARSGMLLSKPYRKQDLGRAVRAALDSDPA
jgi:PAS domain S-box-containing protein